jgi:signal transduction histidine kinase/CheY-like chemotaxis protein
MVRTSRQRRAVVSRVVAKRAVRRPEPLIHPQLLDDTGEQLQLQHDQLRAENEHLVASLRALEDALQRFAEHFDLAPVGYVTLDRSGVIRAINRTACGLLAVERPRLLGTPFRTVVSLADRSVLTRHLNTCRRNGTATSRLALRARDQSLVSVELVSHRSAGDREAYPTAILDLREQERALRERESLLAAARSALDSGKARSDFLAIVSHELRGPLAPMLAAVSALEQRAFRDDDVRRLCEILRRNVSTQARLIEDLLDATRLGRGKMTLQRQPTAFHAVVHEALDPVAAVVAAKKLALTVQLMATEQMIDGDPVRLRQLLGNLLGNAVKFTPERGEISVRTWNSSGWIAVEVSDSGAGIAPEAIPRLFAPFEQVEPRAGALGGLGLGLAICKGIAELHGGRITAASAGPGHGSRFVVELPLMRGRSLLREPVAQRRILLVEDNLDTADALTMALSTSGYAITHVGSVKEALGADLSHVDLVLSDVRLDDGDGRSVLRQLRQRSDVVAIALSGHGDEGDVRESLEAGFFAHLTKPVELDLLTETIDRALASAARAKATAIQETR